jgi:16S rRNA (guanine966-N2)-methyltransferase
MQVIAGIAKGRSLVAPRGSGTRPLTARVKASMFDILGNRIVGARVLDLFAGSGQLGIESLSRGANEATFVEINQQATEVIRKNLQNTNFTERAKIVPQDVFLFLRNKPKHPFTLIFVAPPQYEGIATRTLHELDNDAFLAKGDLLIVQQSVKEPKAETLSNVFLSDERHYGSTSLMFYERFT